MYKSKNQNGKFETENKIGRPTKRSQTNKKISEKLSKMTEDNLNKIRQAFAIDATVEEACFYANISEVTYYNWKKKNPELFKEIERLRQAPILKARQEVVNGLVGFDNSLKYLSKKKKNEFGDKLEIDGSLDFTYNLKVIDKNERFNIDEETKGSF
jgi:hypothetical protein